MRYRIFQLCSTSCLYYTDACLMQIQQHVSYFRDCLKYPYQKSCIAETQGLFLGIRVTFHWQDKGKLHKRPQ